MREADNISICNKIIFFNCKWTKFFFATVTENIRITYGYFQQGYFHWDDILIQMDIDANSIDVTPWKKTGKSKSSSSWNKSFPLERLFTLIAWYTTFRIDCLFIVVHKLMTFCVKINIPSIEIRFLIFMLNLKTTIRQF